MLCCFANVVNVISWRDVSWHIRALEYGS